MSGAIPGSSHTPSSREQWKLYFFTLCQNADRSRWEDNIKMYIQEVGGGCGDWMELAQDRDRWRALANTVRNLRVPKMRGIS